MNLSDIRARLSGLEGRAYWRSLEEFADTPEFREYIRGEFPLHADEFADPAGRRQFLKLMGASLALAGVTAACDKLPQETLVPYVKQPEEVIPGRPLFFATAMPQGGVGAPLLAESHLGRPTKLEGNPEHPASLGATDVLAQASVLSLYDPDRSRNIVNRGEVQTWGNLLAALQLAMSSEKGSGGAGFRLLTGPLTSPSVLEQINTLMAGLPHAKWHQWDAVYGTVQGGAPAATALYHFEKADVVVALDSDFLGFGPAATRYTRDFASRRRLETPTGQLNRMYAVEPVPTLTGAKADHRVALKRRDIATFAAALAAAVGAPGGAATGDLPDEIKNTWLPAVAADLRANRGKSAVVAGAYQPAAVHALARAMNEALGNVGVTVVYTTPFTAGPADGAQSLADLVTDMKAGTVHVLVILDGNPVFTAPADLGFTEALQNVGTRVHVGPYHDETAEQCQWHVNEAHYLESWGDLRSFDGTVSLIQPLIAPLYNGRQAIEVLAALNGTTGKAPDALVKDYWSRAYTGKTTPAWKITDSEGQPFPTVDLFWRTALHDGFIGGTSFFTPGATVPPAPPATAVPAAPASPAMSGTEIVFMADPFILDGRNANNGWLQEMPRPLSKVTWDNVAYVSVATAERMNLPLSRSGNGGLDVLEIKYQGRSVRLPVWVFPGTADDVVAVTFGHGSQRAGRVGTGVGHNIFGLRGSKAPWFDGGAEISRTGESYEVASTQNHFLMESRNPIRVVDAAAYRANPSVVAELGKETPPFDDSLYPPRQYNSYKWGMSIDLNACTGCSACITACIAENNIAVVGKEQVMRSREMHWIRVDTYYTGDLHAPEVYHQPLPCQQCENAPCEVVCPVGATVHSDEGLNDMVYNRCVGTRYCSNNCPYKVRRFNFLLYSDYTTKELFAQRNPDVTVRSRGVMEKCSYCVQRISHARIDAETAGREIKDGEITTACQQVCPASAITFGNLNEPTSRLSALVKQDRHYALLDELNTRPRTTYLAVVRNPNPALEPTRNG